MEERAPLPTLGSRTEIMSPDSDAIRPAAADAVAAPLDLLLTDAAIGVLRRLNLGGSGLRLASAQSCCRSTQLLAGHNRFILSTRGHVAAMVNPPGNDKARYQVAKDSPEDPQDWLRRAATCPASRWPDYAGWLAERCGEERAGPDELGGHGLAPICGAPGTYAHDH
jgi:hypothetical protein